MPGKRRTPALAGNRGSEMVSGYDISENTQIPPEFQQIGSVAAGLIARIARRHDITIPRAQVVVELAGLGRRSAS